MSPPQSSDDRPAAASRVELVPRSGPETQPANSRTEKTARRPRYWARLGFLRLGLPASMAGTLRLSAQHRRAFSAAETGWRRAQSGANPSLPRIPCYQGNIQGKSRILDLSNPLAWQIAQSARGLVGKFATIGNREFESAKQGFPNQEQGIPHCHCGKPSNPAKVAPK